MAYFKAMFRHLPRNVDNYKVCHFIRTFASKWKLLPSINLLELRVIWTLVFRNGVHKSVDVLSAHFSSQYEYREQASIQAVKVWNRKETCWQWSTAESAYYTGSCVSKSGTRTEGIAAITAFGTAENQIKSTGENNKLIRESTLARSAVNPHTEPLRHVHNKTLSNNTHLKLLNAMERSLSPTRHRIMGVIH